MHGWPSGTWPSWTWPLGSWPADPALAPTTGARLTAATFQFKRNFPSLYDSNGWAPDVDTACAVIESEWAGIFTLWATLPAATRDAKRLLCEGYMVAWWLADMYPTTVRGVQGDGGMPLTSKSIGGVSVVRKDMEAQPGLKGLESNAFGMKALAMIMAAPERFLIAGATTSAQLSGVANPWPTGV